MRALATLLILLTIAACAYGAYAWHPAIAPIAPPAPGAFAPDLVRHGETLARLGNCAACHSAPGQAPFSGGVPVVTPFGTVYASNITPDAETGLGHWPEAAFTRAMREGLDRDGRHLYPAFPYDHYTHVTDADNQALYAYLMTRAPAANRVRAPELMFPLNFRPLMAGWKLLFFRPGPIASPPGTDPAVARGAYLVEGLAHCGACHTPRNLLGAEKKGEALAGGEAEGWNAYALNAASPAPVPWTRDSLSFYLAHGWAADHGISRGPMAAVTASLGTVPPADVAAMAAYVMTVMGPPTPEKQAKAATLKAGTPAAAAASAGTQAAAVAAGAPGSDAAAEGAAIYAGACASCHAGTRPLPFGGLPLGLSSAFHAPDPGNIVLVTLHGLQAPPGQAGAIMPGFEGTLDDHQIAALLAYGRETLAGEPPWPDLPATVRKARTAPVTLSPSDGTTAAPAPTDIRVSP